MQFAYRAAADRTDCRFSRDSRPWRHKWVD